MDRNHARTSLLPFDCEALRASVEGKGWTDAEDLKTGDQIRQADGTTGIVWLQWNVHKLQAMYNPYSSAFGPFGGRHTARARRKLHTDLPANTQRIDPSAREYALYLLHLQPQAHS